MNQQPTLMPIGDRLTGKDRKIGSPEEMQEVMRECVISGKYGLPADVPEPEDLLREVDNRAAYELRFRKARFNVNGVVSHVTKQHFTGMLNAALADVVAAAGRELSGSWAIVAARIVWDHRPRIVRHATGVPEEALLNPQITPEGEVKGNAQRTRQVVVKDEDLVLELALAELTQAPPHDPNFEQTGKRAGSRFAYADSGGDLRKLRGKHRQRRESAKEVIRYFYGLEEGAEVTEVRDEVKADIVSYDKAGLSVQRISKALDVSIETVNRVLTAAKGRKETK